MLLSCLFSNNSQFGCAGAWTSGSRPAFHESPPEQTQASRLRKSFPRLDVKHSDNLFACFCPRASASLFMAFKTTPRNRALRSLWCPPAKAHGCYHCQGCHGSITDTLQISRNPQCQSSQDDLSQILPLHLSAELGASRLHKRRKPFRAMRSPDTNSMMSQQSTCCTRMFISGSAAAAAGSDFSMDCSVATAPGPASSHFKPIASTSCTVFHTVRVGKPRFQKPSRPPRIWNKTKRDDTGSK